MFRFAVRRSILSAILAGLLTGSAQAQLPTTRIFSVFPQGAQAGKAVDLTVTNGTDLDELDQMVFNLSLIHI